MILVTGATGMLGGHLIRQLLRENNQVSALRRKSSEVESLKSIFRFYGDDVEDLYNRIRWIEADVEDYFSLCKAFEGIEYVYHCAAMVNLGKNDEKMLTVNVGGTKNVVNAALINNVKKLCFVSSIAALSDGNGQNAIDEVTPIAEHNTTTLYGQSKRLSENEIRTGIQNGLKAVIVNPGVIFGYSKDKTGSSILFDRVKKGMPFFTNGQTGYVAVQDVVKAMILLMRSDISDERYVLTGENCSHKDVLRWMAEDYGVFRPFIGVNRSMLVSAYVLEFFGKFFGFTPLIDSSSARVAISKKSYSSQKFLSVFTSFKFSGIQDSITQICEFDKKVT